MTIRSARKRIAARHDRKPKHRKQGAPTIADVAAYAGFAPMTVSRVINGEDNVRQETREAVQAAIAKLKYSPNLAARTLAGAEQVRIGMLYSNPSAAFLSEFLVGSLEQARLSHIQLVVEKCDVDAHEDDVVRDPGFGEPVGDEDQCGDEEQPGKATTTPTTKTCRWGP